MEATMAALTTKAMNYVTGALPAFGAATAAGDTVEVPATVGQIFLCYRNTAAASRTVTIASPGVNAYGQTEPAPTYTLGTTNGELWIPLHPAMANPAGVLTVTLTTDVGVTVCPVRIG